MLPDKLIKRLQSELKEFRGSGIDIISYRPESGGCINRSYTLETSSGLYFLKTNSASTYPAMFEMEILGLQKLLETRATMTPQSICCGEESGISFLLMEHITAGKTKKDFWDIFGRSLARIHMNSSAEFGLDHNNYIGSLGQSNHGHADWPSFFIDERLIPMVRMARDRQNIDSTTVKRFSELFNAIDRLFPVEKPSLLHGDLWCGNYMVSSAGEPCLIDPAIYFGHREMDIGMTKLFGGFDGQFYGAYNDQFALESGWADRVDLCNLYPLMVHVNLFGGDYLRTVKNILGRFT